MSSTLLPSRTRPRYLGTKSHPWDNLFLTNGNGEPISLREALAGVDRGGGFFYRAEDGINIIFDPEHIGSPSQQLPAGTNEWVRPPYTGNDQPGTGNNTLEPGQLRQWTMLDPVEGEFTFLLMRNMAGHYRVVDATNWS